MAATYEVEDIKVVELDMMDKRKYFPLTALSGFTIRSVLYPFTVIKTRLQVQKHKEAYSGTYDAFRKIVKLEGFRGLYKGFWVSSLLVVPQLSYITTYESVRRYMVENTQFQSNKVRSFVGGFCASMVGQTFIVPIDIVSQHLMMMGKSRAGHLSTTPTKVSGMDPLHVDPKQLRSAMATTKAVIVSVYRRDGLRGFYKGYMASITVYAPNSAMWWYFYDMYCGGLAGIAPVWVPRLLLQCMAAPMGGVSAALITNPMDIVRSRIQIENTKFVATVKTLWQEEGLGIFVKGLSARLVQSVAFSFFIILGYETIKRWSLLEEHKKDIRW